MKQIMATVGVVSNVTFTDRQAIAPGRNEAEFGSRCQNFILTVTLGYSKGNWRKWMSVISCNMLTHLVVRNVGVASMLHQFVFLG